MTTLDLRVGTDLRLVAPAVTGWVVTAAGIAWGAWWSVLVLVVAVGITGGATRRCHRDAPERPATWPAVLAVAAVGAGFAIAIALRVADLDEHPVTSRFGSTATVMVRVGESPRFLGGSRLMFRGTLEVLDGRESYGGVVVFASNDGFSELTAGRPVTFRARLGRPTRPDLTVAVLSATGEPKLGRAPGWQRAAARVRAAFAETARRVLPPDQAAIVPALVLGDTSAVPERTTAEFRAAGLTHLTAVSGANVTIVCGAVLLCASLVGPRVATALAAVVLVVFVVVVQPSASVLRAAVMAAIALVAIVTHRRRQALPALSASVLVLLIAAPELAVDFGFALSVVATAALVLVAPRWSTSLVDRGWPKPLADAVAIAVAAQCVTAPIVAGMSGSISVVSIIANLSVAVVIPPLTVIGTAAAVLAPWWPSAAGLLIRFTGPEVWWLSNVARWAAGVPGATVTVPSGWTGAGCVAGAGAVAVLACRWRWGRVGVAGALLCLLAWAAGRGVDGVGPT